MQDGRKEDSEDEDEKYHCDNWIGLCILHCISAVRPQVEPSSRSPDSTAQIQSLRRESNVRQSSLSIEKQYESPGGDPVMRTNVYQRVPKLPLFLITGNY